MSIASARVQPALALEAPIDKLRDAGMRTSLFQGCAYAVDPRDTHGYLFQLQAVRVGPGDVEDLRVHRFAVTGPTDLQYLDTMTVLRGGHVQQAHARISQEGVPYLWLGLERYDDQNQQQGADLYRVRYVTPEDAGRPGGALVPRDSSVVQRVYTGDGSASAVGCPDWTIVLRRPGKTADTYEWHRERYLLSAGCQKAAKAGQRPNPWHTVTVPKTTADDDYQSSVAQGKYDAKGRRVYRITGADRILVESSDSRGKPLNLTAAAQKQLGVDHVEPEGGFTLGGLLHVAVQVGSISERRVAYLPLKW